MNNTQQLLVKVSPELQQRLREQALERGLTLTGYIRMVLTERAKLVDYPIPGIYPGDKPEYGLHKTPVKE